MSTRGSPPAVNPGGVELSSGKQGDRVRGPVVIVLLATGRGSQPADSVVELVQAGVVGASERGAGLYDRLVKMSDLGR